MSKQDITVTGGEVPAVDHVDGAPEPTIVSASQAQKQNQEALVEPTSERPEAFDFAGTVSRRPSEN
jgi:hypothetical protein